jgi:hypothetical protein
MSSIRPSSMTRGIHREIDAVAAEDFGGRLVVVAA